MSDLEKRMTAMETKLKTLEETLETLKNMSLSEQMESYIQKRSQALKMVDLLNSVSDQPPLDISKEEAQVKNIQAKKNDLDRQISQALDNFEDSFDINIGNADLFSYEIETGVEWLDVSPWKDQISGLSEFVDKGIRITGYKGFDTEKVVIPNIIEGKPVISIGDKAFMNIPMSEIVLPKSLIAIMSESFEGCQNLKKVVLPNGVRYLGQKCFSSSGLSEIEIPESISKIPPQCFYMCYNLSKVRLCKNVSILAYKAFQHCQKLQHVLLPDKIESINSKCFEDTKIDTIIVPTSVQKIYSDSFSKETTKMAFLGKDTIIDDKRENNMRFTVIYCLPGSNAQIYARKNNIPVKPLSEFKMEDYDV